MRGRLEEVIFILVHWLRLAVETTSILIIGIGFTVAISALVTAAIKSELANFTAVRLLFARYLTLALEFQLAADILSTAIAPGWEQVGQLGAIAVIRTGLNYFLSLEIEHERSVQNSRGLS